MPKTSAGASSRRASAQAASTSPAPSRLPISACAAIATESSASATRIQSWKPIWCAATCASPMRAATAAASRNAAVKASERRPRSRAARSCGGMRSEEGASGAPRRTSRMHEVGRGGDLRDDVRDRRALDAEPEAADQRERERDAREVGEPEHDEAACACPGTRASSPGRRPITSMNGAPSAAMRNQSAPARRQAWLPPAIRRSAGPAATSRTTAQTSPSASASQVACTPTSSASGRCPAPYSRATLAVVPYSRNVHEADDLGEQRARRSRARRAARGPGARRSPCRRARTAARRRARRAPGSASRMTVLSPGVSGTPGIVVAGCTYAGALGRGSGDTARARPARLRGDPAAGSTRGALGAAERPRRTGRAVAAGRRARGARGDRPARRARAPASRRAATSTGAAPSACSRSSSGG